MHDSVNTTFGINKNMLVEKGEIRRRLSKLKKSIQKLGKDFLGKFVGFFFTFKVGEINISKKRKDTLLTTVLSVYLSIAVS